MTQQVRTIRVINVVQGDKDIKKLARNYGQLNKGVAKTSKTLDVFKRAFQLSIAGIGIRGIIKAADSFQLLRDRIKVFTGSSAAANKAFKQLQQAARFTRTSVASLAEAYNRVALSTKELGLSSEQIIAVTTALQQTFRLSGSTTAEATASTIQLTQGLSAGALRGQELRSVLEANATFAGLLADELKITRGQLIKFAESGKITSDVVLNALGKNFKDLNKDAAQLGTTFQQAVTIGLDSFRDAIDKVNQKLGLSSKFATAILFMVDNFKKFAIVIGGILSAGLIVKLGSQLVALGVAIKGGALLAFINPISLLVAALATAGISVAFLIDKINNPGRNQLVEDIDKTTKKIASLNNQLTELNERRAKIATDADKKTFDFFNVRGAGTLLQQIKRLTEDLDGFKKKLAELPPPAEDFGKKMEDALGDFAKNTKKGVDALDLLNFKLKEGIININQYDDAVANIRLTELNKKFKEGKIDIDAYADGMVKINNTFGNFLPLSTGAEIGLRKIGNSAVNVAAQIERAFVKTFKVLEDSILDFTKKGTFNFAKFTQTVLDELARIIIRATIIAPLARALQFGIGTLFAGGGPASAGTGAAAASSSQFGANSANTVSPTFANGGVINQGRVIPFASGGVVSSPTSFPLAGGNTGLMGEAGPEGILPLIRRNGKLGVQGGGTNVQVNIINNTSADIESTETVGPDGERMLDLVITKKIRENISNGLLDRDLSENFGLRRKGR